MTNRKSKSNLLAIILLIFSFGILLPTSNGFSQNFLIINENIGGDNTGTTNQENNSDNVALFVVGALLIGGFIAYSLLKNDKEKSDSTETSDKSSLLIQGNSFDTFKTKIQKVKDSIPVDIIVGIRKEEAFISERTYLLGVSFRF